jgi:hemerythrin-like domain-containing protein
MATTKKKSSSSGSRSRSNRSAPKDAIALLKQDHADVKELLSQLERTTTRAASKRMTLLEKIARMVRVHAKIEEEIFYPAFAEAGDTSEDEKLGYEAKEEHGLVDIVLPELEATDASTELFSARAKVLKDLIEHHAEEEERQMFPRAKKLIERDELVQLGESLASRKEDLESGGEFDDGHAVRNGNRAEARMQSSRAALQGEDEEELGTDDADEEDEDEGEVGDGAEAAERVRSSRAGMGSRKGAR